MIPDAAAAGGEQAEPPRPAPDPDPGCRENRGWTPASPLGGGDRLGPG